jgi:hypothetical protein
MITDAAKQPMKPARVDIATGGMIQPALDAQPDMTTKRTSPGNGGKSVSTKDTALMAGKIHAPG